MLNIDDSYLVRVSIQQAICDYQAPHVLMRPKVYQDGNKWCALYGVNIQDGVCGFGDTPAEACADFDACWYGSGKHKRELQSEVKK